MFGLVLLHTALTGPSSATVSGGLMAGLALYALVFGLLVHVAPQTRITQRLWMAAGHSFYWLLTVPALADAMQRMARGDLRWLKTPHKPYAAAAGETGCETGRMERVKGIEPSS